MSFVPLPCPTSIDPTGSCSCSSDAIVTSVAASITAITLLPPFADRKGAILWNDSTATAFLKLGAGASTTSYTWKIASQSGYELSIPIYVGEISAVWDAANGSMRITELV